MTQKQLDRLLPLDLVPGLDCYELDRRLLCAARADGATQRTMAFYLFDLHDRGDAQMLGFSRASHYAVARLEVSPRRANELIQAGGVLRDLEELDEAFLVGRIGWSKVVELSRVVEAHNVKKWLELAGQLSCAALKKAVSQARRGQEVSGESGGGLPRPAFEFRAGMDLERKDRTERLREELMRKGGHLVSDDDLFDVMLETLEQKLECEAPDPEKDAARRAACEDKETPDWLRKEVFARDGFRCVHCDQAGGLHAHHIVFREHGGRTSAENLTALCQTCHGMVHSDLLGIEGEAPGDLRISDRHGAPVTARAEEAQRLLNVIRHGGRPPELELPDSTTIAWIQAHPRLEWIWTDGYRVKPGAPAYRPKDHREESPYRETIEWIKRQPDLDFDPFHGLIILFDN